MGANIDVSQDYTDDETLIEAFLAAYDADVSAFCSLS